MIKSCIHFINNEWNQIVNHLLVLIYFHPQAWEWWSLGVRYIALEWVVERPLPFRCRGIMWRRWTLAPFSGGMLRWSRSWTVWWGPVSKWEKRTLYAASMTRELAEMVQHSSLSLKNSHLIYDESSDFICLHCPTDMLLLSYERLFPPWISFFLISSSVQLQTNVITISVWIYAYVCNVFMKFKKLLFIC